MGRRNPIGIAAFGTGGAGGYFGGRLAQAGEEVIFIARGKHLRVESTLGDMAGRPAESAS